MTSEKHTNQTDEELLHSYRSTNDNIWLGYLLQRYTLLLFGVAMKYLKDKDAAQDAVQQVNLKVLTHLPVGEINNFKGWLYVLMRNHCLQLLRDKIHTTDENILTNLPANEIDKEEQQQTYTPVQMNESLAELNEEQRTTVILFYLKKLSYQQIMEQTGYTFMQVKSYIQNGKRNLKTILIKKLNKNK